MFEYAIEVLKFEIREIKRHLRIFDSGEEYPVINKFKDRITELQKAIKILQREEEK